MKNIWDPAKVQFDVVRSTQCWPRSTIVRVHLGGCVKGTWHLNSDLLMRCCLSLHGFWDLPRINCGQERTWCVFCYVTLVRKSFICVTPITQTAARRNLSFFPRVGQGDRLCQTLGRQELCETDTKKPLTLQNRKCLWQTQNTNRHLCFGEGCA